MAIIILNIRFLSTCSFLGVSCEPCSGGKLQLDRFQKPAHLKGPQTPQGHLALAGDEGEAADGLVHIVMKSPYFTFFNPARNRKK